MNLFYNHFKFRVAQLFRIGNLESKMGLTFLIVALAVICVELPKIEYYPIAFSLPILGFHFRRKDISFLRKIFINKWQPLIFIEYTLLYILFVLVNINYTINIYSFIPLLFFVALVFIIPKTNKNVFHLKFIPDFYFEWKSYFRQNFWLCLLGYAVLISAAYHKSTLVFSAFLFYGFLAFVFQPNENKEMLTLFFQNFSLKQKVYFNLKFLNLLLSPVAILFAILNPSDFGYALYYIIFYNLIFALIIARKYSLYNHKKESNYFDMGTSLLYFIASALIIPAVFILIENYKEADENIQNYVGNK